MPLETKKRTTRTARSKNNNIATFVDAVTPEPKLVTENFIDIDKLTTYLKTAKDTEKQLVEHLVDIVLSCNKQEEFLSTGERIAFNTLRKLQILY
jgi:hypothetical protein